MYAVCFCDVGKFSTIISLEYARSIAKVGDSTLQEINGGEAALFHVWINKPFSGSLINDRILVEFLWHLPGVAGRGHILYIHLPFYADFIRRVVTTADKAYPDTSMVKFNGVKSC